MNVASTNLHSATPGLRTTFDQARQAESENIPVIRRYLRIGMRWRYVIIGATAACILLGLLITFMMTPKYTAVTTIEISRESNKVTDIQGVEREASVGDQEFYQTQYGLLRSRVLSERVAAELKLVDDPKFFELYRVRTDGAAFKLVNGQFAPGGRQARLRVAGDVLLSNLSVMPMRLSRLLDVGFTSPDPAFSARVANSWADNFIRTNLERKIQATSYGRNLLQRQLGQAKEKLDQSQRQLVNYASAEKIINLPTQGNSSGATSERSIVADQLSDLNRALSEATSDRIRSEARYREAGNASANTQALANIAINGLREKRAQLGAEYQRLMTQFEPGYPAARELKAQLDELGRSIAREEGRISSGVLAEYRQSLERERSLQAKVDQLKEGYLDLRRRSIQYNIYQQEVDTNRALYDGLLQRFKEIGVAGGVGINNIAIVDPANVPERPSSPRVAINMALAVLMGLALGCFLAFALEQLDEAIADPAEIERRLGLPLLGSVPQLENGTPQEALLDRKSEMVDAYLAVQTNLGFTTEHGVPRSLAVTSTRPAEGKSTTSLALATMLSRAQRRVILVDGDMRSPSVHQYAGISHDRGLSNFLAGQDDLAGMVHFIDDLGLSVMTAGPVPPNAAELLTGNRLELLVQRLLEEFDHVVIDSPPVMGLADAPLIANRVEGVVYAVESHGIRSSMVKTALGRLTSANARILGGVLTKFQAKKAHYGYGYEYGYGYGRDAAARAKVARGG